MRKFILLMILVVLVVGIKGLTAHAVFGQKYINFGTTKHIVSVHFYGSINQTIYFATYNGSYVDQPGIAMPSSPQQRTYDLNTQFVRIASISGEISRVIIYTDGNEVIYDSDVNGWLTSPPSTNATSTPIPLPTLTPTAIPVPTLTPTPFYTSTPMPTNTPSPSPSPSCSPTPIASPTPTPTPIPVPDPGEAATVGGVRVVSKTDNSVTLETLFEHGTDNYDVLINGSWSGRTNVDLYTVNNLTPGQTYDITLLYGSQTFTCKVTTSRPVKEINYLEVMQQAFICIGFVMPLITLGLAIVYWKQISEFLRKLVK